MENLTILELLQFQPFNVKEKEIYNFYSTNDYKIIKKIIKKLDNDRFYLGNKIKLTHNDLINLNLVYSAKEMIEKEEMDYNHSETIININNEIDFELDLIEIMLIKYNEIIELRKNNNLIF